MQKSRFSTCILHIGTEKTGSTAIQYYLGRNRRELERQGFLYPTAENADHTSQWEFVAVSQREPWTQDVGRELAISNSAARDTFRENLRAKLDKEFQSASQTNTLIISSEHFQSRLYNQDEIEYLKEYLKSWVDDFKIVVYFRRQDELALSLLSTRIKSSVQIDISDVIRTLNASPRYYAYDDIYRRWANVFGTDAMIPRIYDTERWPNGDLIADFCQASSIPKLSHPPARYNLSLNRKGFHFVQALNNIYNGTNNEELRSEHRQLVRLISEKHAGKFYPISRSQAKQFYDKFQQTNEQLRSLAFPELESPLFSTDFAAYPDVAEQIQPDYDDAVKIAIEFWRSSSGPNEDTFWSRIRKRRFWR